MCAMYKEHPTFVQPENEEAQVWRYMDFTKFVALLESRALFFSRVDKLGDPFEGSWPIPNILARELVPEDVPEEGRSKYLEAMGSLGKALKEWPKLNAVNCWHMNSHESAAMWKLYLKSDEGVAVQSKYCKLRDSIIDHETVHLGIVNYIDYQTQGVDPRFFFSSIVHKRKSFEHEQEIRAVVTKWPVAVNNIADFTKETIGHGVEISVDLAILIERVFVAPTAPTWFTNVVRGVIKRYGFNFEVHQSRLTDQPMF